VAASAVLVTGATGSAGSNVCRLAAERGMAVRGLVRPGTDVGPLERCGAAPVVGDVTEPETLDAAMEGVVMVVHCAAQIGGTWSTATPADYEAVNQQGSINVLDAAARAGVGRTVMLLSAIVFDRSETLTERSRVVPIGSADSPYVSTKRAAYYEGMARAARGAEISFVVPGGIYGPSIYVDRALVPTIFTGTLVMAARRELQRYLPMPISWVLAEDVAAIALLAGERGKRGARYLAMGRPDDACSLPAFCNRFLKLAGIPHTVEEFDPQKPGAADDPEFGPMVRMLQACYPEPPHDCSRTTEELGYAPTPLATGLQVTLDWMRQHDRLPVAAQ
jgi:dihydroflavonol-4-reductase